MRTCVEAPVLASLALDLPEEPEVRVHVAACAPCAKELRLLRETASHLALSLSPVEPSPELRAALVSGLSGVVPFAGFTRRVARLFDLSNDAAQWVLANLSKPSLWETHVPGVDLFHLEAGPLAAGADAGFVRFAAGLPYPLHEHHGEEVMFLLAGSLQDDVTQEVARAGDVLVHGAGTSHSFHVGRGEPCLVALLLHGGEPTLL